MLSEINYVFVCCGMLLSIFTVVCDWGIKFLFIFKFKFDIGIDGNSLSSSNSKNYQIMNLVVWLDFDMI